MGGGRGREFVENPLHISACCHALTIGRPGSCHESTAGDSSVASRRGVCPVGVRSGAGIDPETLSVVFFPFRELTPDSSQGLAPNTAASRQWLTILAADRQGSVGTTHYRRRPRHFAHGLITS